MQRRRQALTQRTKRFSGYPARRGRTASRTGSKRELLERVNAALPFMDGDMQELAVRALQKIDALTEAEFAGLAVKAHAGCPVIQGLI